VTTQPQESPAAAPAAVAPFRRVLLKLSGESLMGPLEFGVDAPPELIDVVVGRFQEAGARASDGTPKVERALALLGLR